MLGLRVLRCPLCLLPLLSAVLSAGQFGTCALVGETDLRVEQMDTVGGLTTLYFTYRKVGRGRPYQPLSIGARAHLEVPGNRRERQLVGWSNISMSNDAAPTETRVEYVDGVAEHRFVLQFEPLPAGTARFTFAEKGAGEQDGWRFEVVCDTTRRRDPGNLEAFVYDYPAREFGYVVHEGQEVWHSAFEGLVVSVRFTKLREYGKYIRLDLSVKNTTSHSVLFDPQAMGFEAYCRRQGNVEVVPSHVLTREEYLKMVQFGQFWQDLAQGVAMYGKQREAESMATVESDTHYSWSSSSTSHTSGITSYGYTDGSGSSHTTVRDNRWLYDRQRELQAEQRALYEAQAEQLKQYSDGYMKRHSIAPGTEYVGFMMADYKRGLEGHRLWMTLDGERFEF